MVTWQGNAPHSWPHGRRPASPGSADGQQRDLPLDSSEALRAAADLAGHAEAALEPDTPPDTSHRERLLADQRMVEAILEEEAALREQGVLAEGQRGPRH